MGSITIEQLSSPEPKVRHNCCPHCGGVVTSRWYDPNVEDTWVGTDVYGGEGDAYLVYECERCGHREDYDFSGDYEEVCSTHAWRDVDEWSTEEFPDGVDACTENMIFMYTVRKTKQRCLYCGAERLVSEVTSTGAPLA